MPYSDYVYEILIVIDEIDDTVSSYSNAPQVASTLQLYTVVRSWISRQAFNLWEYPVDDRSIQRFQFSSCGPCKGYAVLSHSVFLRDANVFSLSAAIREAH